MSVDRSDLNERIATSRAVLGHPYYQHPNFCDRLSVQEGTHYDVLAYTDRVGVFYPTIVRWRVDAVDSAVDDLSDLECSARLRRDAERIHSEGGHE